jgi:hypothetical protein
METEFKLAVAGNRVTREYWLGHQKIEPSKKYSVKTFENLK